MKKKVILIKSSVGINLNIGSIYLHKRVRQGNVMIGYKDCWRGVGGWWVAHNIRIFLKNMYLFENVTEFQNIIV